MVHLARQENQVNLVPLVLKEQREVKEKLEHKEKREM